MQQDLSQENDAQKSKQGSISVNKEDEAAAGAKQSTSLMQDTIAENSQAAAGAAAQ